jgi:hypothetical protein
VDLVQGRGRHEEDLGLVSGDGRVGDDLDQILLELVQRDVLVVCGDLDAGIVCAEEDKLLGWQLGQCPEIQEVTCLGSAH